jgi:hypothetical protein
LETMVAETAKRKEWQQFVDQWSQRRWGGTPHGTTRRQGETYLAMRDEEGARRFRWSWTMRRRGFGHDPETWLSRWSESFREWGLGDEVDDAWNDIRFVTFSVSDSDSD